jgi:hypothetical protein
MNTELQIPIAAIALQTCSVSTFVHHLDKMTTAKYHFYSKYVNDIIIEIYAAFQHHNSKMTNSDVKKQ